MKKILILGDSTTEQILPFLSFKCKHLPFRNFKLYFPESSECVYFGSTPKWVGIKLWIHYGDLQNTFGRYDVVIINAGIHDLAPLHHLSMKKYIQKRFPDNPYLELGYGHLPFKEKPSPIYDYLQNIRELLKILNEVPQVKYFFISTKFGRWYNIRNKKYECSDHPQRNDLLKIINEQVVSIVNERHYLNLQQYSLASSLSDDLLFRDAIHADLSKKESIKRLKLVAQAILGKMCQYI